MKYCQKCGAECEDEAVVCLKCGCELAALKKGKKDDGLGICAKVFLILGCIAQALILIPLAWCLPITISIFGKINRGEHISVGLKVCALLFVNLIGGILLLCRNDD